MHIKKVRISPENLFLLFNIIKRYHNAFFLSGYRGSMYQARKKWVVSDVPIGKPVVTFMLPPKSKHT